MATIIGTAGVDFLVGTTTSDLVLGEDADDTLLGEAGDDELYGNAGNDLILGRADNDLLNGGAGNDTGFGNEGNDRLVGEEGADSLYGDAGQDQLSGGLGNDTLVGGAGADSLTGGQGRDVFVLSNGGGGAQLAAADIITDFQDRQDQIRLADGLKFRNLSITQGTGRNSRDTVIRNKLTGEYLAVVQRVNATKITRKDIKLITLPVQDTSAPGVANLAIATPTITIAGGTSQTFTVQYADAVQLNSASFGIGDLLVTGPEGFSQAATLVSFTPAGNGTSRTVTYQVSAPGGTWDANDNGSYQITLQGEQVFDTSGNFISTTALGNFAVNVPIPPSTISVAVAPSSAPEDDGTALVYTFTRAGYIRNNLPVSFSLGGTAVRNTDYTLTGGIVTGNTGTVTFAANSATATVRVVPTADSLIETNETVILSLVAGTGYLLDPASSATSTITDDESQIALAITPASVTEDSPDELTYTFTRTGFTNRQVVVNLTLGGTATFGGATSDYTLSTAPGTISTFATGASSLTFAVGETTKVVKVKSIADGLFEPDETVNLTITNGTGYIPLTTSPVQGTLLNDESQVSVAVAPTQALEDGTPNLVYTFTRAGFTGSALTVNFSVGGTATFEGAEADYIATANAGTFTFGATSGTLSFAAGETTRTVTIDPTVDNTQEANETVLLGVTSGTGYVVGTATLATGTILNDEGSVSLSISPASVLENSGTDLVYTFNRSTFTTNAVTVNFSVAGTAVFNTDYTISAPTGNLFTFNGTSGTIQFGAGNTSRTLKITPVGDAAEELNEEIVLTLQDGTGYTSQTLDPVVGTIVNDDATVTLAVLPNSIAEDNGTPFTYTFNRVGSIAGALTVKFNVAGTATFGAGNDYTVSGSTTFDATQGTITFAAGQSAVTLNVTPIQDLTTIEPDETVSLALVADTSYTVGTLTPVQATILNDDGVVSNTNDSGPGSLRQAILAANNSTSLVTPTITFTGAALTGTINLAAALPDLARSMTIDGPGAANLTVQRGGSGSYRIFTVQNGATVTIQDLTVANGNVSGGNGGGILNSGILTLQDSLVSGNTAALGGGIYNQNGTLTLNNTRVIGNTASSAGGGINIQAGTVNLLNGTSLEANTATSIGGGVANSGTLNVTGSGTTRISFSGNQAINSSGGGIYNAGIATVNFGNFVNNQASGIGVGGGAILNVGASTTLSVGNSVFNASPLNLPNNIAGAFTNAGGNTPLNP